MDKPASIPEVPASAPPDAPADPAPLAFKPATTPAGSQINSNWIDLERGAREFGSFCALVYSQDDTTFAIFRCGTVVAVRPEDRKEFTGYSADTYQFPFSPEADAKIVKRIMVDNRAVWDAQRRTGPAEISRAMRIAYGKMISDGYVYPGTARSGRSAIQLWDSPKGDFLWQVYWPELQKDVYNIVYGADRDSALRAAGDLRRYDYMFPEVAAVITRGGAVWTYDAKGVFSAGTPP